MKSLKIWQPIAIIFLVMLATNVVVLALLLADRNDPINTIAKEQSGVRYLEPLRQLRQWLPVYRRLAETDPKLADPAARPPSLENIEKAMTRLDDLDRALEHQLDTTEDFVGLTKDWTGFQKATSNPQSLREEYVKLNTQIRGLIAVVGDSAGLVLDSGLNTYYLVNVAVVDLPNTDDLLNNLLDFGNKLIAQPQLSAADTNRLLIMTASLQRGLDDTNSHLKVAMDADTELASLDMLKREYDGKVRAVMAYLDANMIRQKSAKATLAEYASVVQAALDTNFKLYDAVSPSLDRALQQRGDTLRADVRRVIGFLLLLVLAGLVLTVWLARSLTVRVERAIKVLEVPEVPAPAGTANDEELKLLVAELVLENRSLRKKN